MAAPGSLATSGTINGLLRGLVVGSGQIGVFVEYTPYRKQNFRLSLLCTNEDFQN
jgi:hypothetical protein